MKKWCWAFLFLFLPKFGSCAITDEGVVREKSFTIHYSTTIAASVGVVPASSPTAVVLISLSTPTGWGHVDRKELDISHIDCRIDKLAASTCTIKIGVVNFVGNSTGSVTFFWAYSNQRNVSNTSIPEPTLYPQAFIRARVQPQVGPTDGLTPFIVSNDTRSGSGVYQNTRFIPTASLITPNVIPMVGDIVMEATNFDATNSIIVNLEIVYHSEAQ